MDWYGRISSVCLAARLAAFYVLHLLLSFSIVQNPPRDLTPTLHHRRSISYDDHSNCSHMPMLTQFMTCIVPPSYFLFLFVCVPSIYSFYSSSYVCAYLSPSIFCLSSGPSAKPISSRTLCYIHVYIPIPGLPPTSVVPHSSPSNFRRALGPTILILISHSFIPTPPPYLLAHVSGY